MCVSVLSLGLLLLHGTPYSKVHRIVKYPSEMGPVPSPRTAPSKEVVLSFDEIMERSGLEPAGSCTVLLMELDDLNLEGLIGQDIVDAVMEAVRQPTDVFEYRVLNMLYFAGLVWERLLQSDKKQVATTDPADRLQRRRPDRDCN